MPIGEAWSELGHEGLPTCPVADLPCGRPRIQCLSTLVCLHSLVLAAGRKQLEACGSGTVSLWGHCGRQAAFKDWKQQVPVIESRGMVFTHYRKPGMLLGDFYLLRKASFWQSPKDCWLDPTLGRPRSVSVGPRAHVGSVHVCVPGPWNRASSHPSRMF